jgi:O-antigen ligase
LIFLVFVATDLLGGFRSRVIDLMLILSIMFYLEGLVRSRLLPILVLSTVLVGAFVLPFADKLPLSVQRSLTFLPLNLDEEAVLSAKASTEWRLEMWSSILPMIPQYLILGKGLGIDAHDFAMMMTGLNKGGESAAGSMMAGDYHNGPLSIIIPFGIFGMIGWIWFLVAGFKLLQKNYRYGDPAYERINRFLFAFFIVKIIVFFFIFGSFYSDLAFFTGPIGLSLALNGGIRSTEPEPVVRPTVNRFRLVNADR